ASFLGVIGEPGGQGLHRRFQYSVKMGDRSIYNENTSVVVPVQRSFVHPKYSVTPTVKNDVGLLQLQHPVNFTVNIQPVCIPRENFHVKAMTRFWGPLGL
uniref:Peptidase S1 domain-containing protein n=1 Tax=Saimiri boliviensis boliviensis TaxID=39432 RepID=A0A2K6TZF6_SAIBB